MHHKSITHCLGMTHSWLEDEKCKLYMKRKKKESTDNLASRENVLDLLRKLKLGLS